MLTIDEVKQKGWLIFEAIVGSKAYGLNTASSDTDIRGVFVLPRHIFYSLEYTPQVANETNDIVYYELRRFVELLSKNNPNILELLNLPDECILYKHPIMNDVQPGLFLSKICEQSFANYAYTQIKKAYGLEKKIMKPMEEQRKSALDFCFVYTNNRTEPLRVFLERNQWQQEQIGLSAIDHLRDSYAMFYGSHTYAGILRKADANDVCLSSIPKGEQSVGLLYFNKDGYSVYCKQYREYQDWLTKRNEVRYASTLEHGKRYDAKNMMHVFRLLRMAKEIAVEGKINVRRTDREYLLSIKQGKYEYEDLLLQAEALKAELPGLYANADLIQKPDANTVNELLIKMRESYYGD